MTSTIEQVTSALASGERVCAKPKGGQDWCSIDAIDVRHGNLFAHCSEEPQQPGFTPGRGEWFAVKDIEVQ